MRFQPVFLKNLRVSLFLTRRSFTRGNKSLLITPIVIMAVIFINLLFVPALIQGTINANNNQLTNHLFSNFMIAPVGNNTDLAYTDIIQSDITSTAGVAAATATYDAGYQLAQDQIGGKWTVLAIDPATYYKVFNDTVLAGSQLQPEDPDGIVLGSLIAGNGHESSPTYQTSLKGVEIGESIAVRLVSGEQQRFTTRGVIDDHYFMADNRAFIARDKLDKLLPASKNRAMAVYVKTEPGADQAHVRQQLAHIFPAARVWDTQELAGNVQDTVATIQTINKIISLLSLLVGAITIFIVTYVDLMTRRRQIGIERAVGIRDGSIIITYVLRAILCTIVGIGLGGLVFRFGIIPYFAHDPFTFPTGEVSLVYQPLSFINYSIILMGIATVAAIIPSIRSVRVKLLDAIWG